MFLEKLLIVGQSFSVCLRVSVTSNNSFYLLSVKRWRSKRSKKQAVTRCDWNKCLYSLTTVSTHLRMDNLLLGTNVAFRLNVPLIMLLQCGQNVSTGRRFSRSEVTINNFINWKAEKIGDIVTLFSKFTIISEISYCFYRPVLTNELREASNLFLCKPNIKVVLI